ncbi:efflux RND transporter permease subunit [Oscillatoria sp. FACHB-1406]|uniref:efflux RND transporter permease subunit n=1 Tax=Oscillatoria sp. FACHB-1406 TaxID=2692846 RepID=UPI0016854C06|nr:efflux RND transporter permease subunit [Oscillatoria sp. FACHB-1406]MBD2576787.1 efflux RND transporter permease subunit [Oscillatoria sp. FACHB-1406]
MFVNAFIKRPVLTSVCSLIIVILGAIAGLQLPIARLPEIAPTQVQVSAIAIGADAQTVENTVTTILEREINGVEGMKYIESSSSNNGFSQITVTFDSNADPDLAQVNVQNRVASAESQLPESVKQTGIVTEKASSNLLMVIGFYAKDKVYDDIFISNYVDLFVLDSLRRVEGVGRAFIFGERKYAMRIWLDPNALASRGLTALDAANALREQNVQIGVGAIAQQPAPSDGKIQLPLRVEGRLKSVEEFENLVIKTNSDGSLVKLKDVGRAELGAETYDSTVQIRSNPGVGIGIYQLPGSNALEVARNVQNAIAELKQDFPPGLEEVIAFDTTEFVKTSLEEVLITLIIAIALVILIIFIFLQDWRTTVIPAVAIPVSLVGTLAFLKIFGFEINSLTLFGLVLATGLVVDDAIVVVEAIATKIQQGKKPRQAAIEAMQELTGAVIATSIVLMAVFIPVAFFPGSTGKIYQQFALTIAFSILLSTFNALTFSPSMSALLLRPLGDRRGPLAGFFRRFNAIFAWIIRRYRAGVEFLVRLRYIVLACFISALAFTFWMYEIVPGAFIPEEDQGYFLGIVQTPEGVSLNYTQGIMEKVDKAMQSLPEVKSTFVITGFSFGGSAPNQGIFFGTLKPWEERRSQEQSVYGILGRLNAELQKIPEALIFALNAPPVQGLSNFGGFEFQLQDRSGGRFSINDLVQSAYALMENANKKSGIAQAFTQFTANTPQLQLEIDRDRAKSLNININEALTTLGAYIGSQYVNDFTYGSRSYRVYIQAEPKFRATPEAINQIYVRSQDNRLIPLSNIIKTTPVTSAPTITHFNLFRAIKLQGQTAPGASSSDAIASMEQAYQEIAAPGFGYEWMGTALEERSSGNQAPIIFGLGLVMVFLVLAAQYESYIDPVIILLSVPLALLGALSFLYLRGLNLDVYGQVGLVMLIGLASKNAILIVEFANQRLEEGSTVIDAALEAGEQRFRPILMTAISSLVGFFPLVIATGAGSASRWSLGSVVFGGLLVATFLSFFLVPILYIIIKSLELRYFPAHEHHESNESELLVPIPVTPSSPTLTTPSVPKQQRPSTHINLNTTVLSEEEEQKPKPSQRPSTQINDDATGLNEEEQYPKTPKRPSTQINDDATGLNEEEQHPKPSQRPSTQINYDATGLNEEEQHPKPSQRPSTQINYDATGLSEEEQHPKTPQRPSTQINYDATGLSEEESNNSNPNS